MWPCNPWSIWAIFRSVGAGSSSSTDPVTRWTFDRSTLLGDAAHPMYPIGSNGASQAILDARVFAGCLRAEHDVVVALERYESIRLPATAAIVEANRGLGPEVPMQLVHERAPEVWRS